MKRKIAAVVIGAFVASALIGCLRATPPSTMEILSLLVELANGYAPDEHLVEFEGTTLPIRIATLNAVAQGVGL